MGIFGVGRVHAGDCATVIRPLFPRRALPAPEAKVCAAVFHSEAIRIGSRNRARQQWHVTGPTD